MTITEQLREYGECVVDAYPLGCGVAVARMRIYNAGKELGLRVRTHIVRTDTNGFVRGHLAKNDNSCRFCCIQHNYGLCENW